MIHRLHYGIVEEKTKIKIPPEDFYVTSNTSNKLIHGMYEQGRKNAPISEAQKGNQEVNGWEKVKKK